VRETKDARATSYLPLAGLIDRQDPQLVRDVLTLERPPPTQSLLESLGWGPVEPWDGRIEIFDLQPAALAPNLTPEPLGFSSSPNPFAPGPALPGDSLPYGRQREVTRLLDMVHHGGSVRIMGPRRSGKTSLLNYVRKAAGDRFVLAVSLQESGRRPQIPAELAALLLPDLAEDADPKVALERRLSAEQRPLVLLDEIGYLDQAEPGLLAWLRALGQRHAAIVYFGSRRDWARVVGRAEKVGSSFGNDVRAIELGELDLPVARRFLVETAPPDAVIPDEPLARWVVERCGGWPFYLQAMGYALVESHRMGQPIQEKAAFTELYRTELLRGWNEVFASLWDDIPVPAQRILAREVTRLRERKQSTLPGYDALGSHERGYLEDQGLIDFERGWLLDQPFQDWLRERSTLRIHSTDPEDEHGR
ncbi:MAG: ATP-binding protein, partial [Myxococcales bacterium]|nr:ATP-binding protein [Myxococcales bacterium]